VSVTISQNKLYRSHIYIYIYIYIYIDTHTHNLMTTNIYLLLPMTRNRGKGPMVLKVSIPWQIPYNSQSYRNTVKVHMLASTNQKLNGTKELLKTTNWRMKRKKYKKNGKSIHTFGCKTDVSVLTQNWSSFSLKL